MRPARRAGLIAMALAAFCMDVRAQPPLHAQTAVAVGDLARRLGIEPAAIAVLDARAVVWPDRSLGCPQPGMMYAQVQQDGYVIRLGAAGREYRYHGGGARATFLCDKPAG